jgi:integrase
VVPAKEEKAVSLRERIILDLTMRGGEALVEHSLGLRRSELCGILPEDIDWGGRRVYIRPVKGTRARWVEANDMAIEACARLAPDLLRAAGAPGLITGVSGSAAAENAGQPERRSTLEGSRRVAVHETSPGGRLHTRYPDRGTSLPIVGYAPNWFTMIVNEACARAGLPLGRRKAHMLRASFASHLIQGGASVPTVSRLLGHANISTTHRYAAVWESDKRRAVEVLSLPA